MKMNDFDNAQDELANTDVHQLILQGRTLHDRAVFEVLATLTKNIQRFLLKPVAALTGAGAADVKIPRHERAS
jgi:hypothetical protein